MRVLIACFGNLMFVSLLMDYSCMAPLTPTVMVMRGFVFHLLFLIISISGSYLLCLCVRACFGNLLWQYVNSMSWVVIVGEGAIGVRV